jgi:hypothetical protein
MYELGRFVACCVMIFGALYLSLPLAIIGNEYDKAWNNIQDEIAETESQIAIPNDNDEAQTTGDTAPQPTKRSFIQFDPKTAAKLQDIGNNEAKMSEVVQERKAPLTWDERHQLVQSYSPMILSGQIMRRTAWLLSEPQISSVTIATARALSDINAWLPAFQLSVEEVLRAMYLVSVKSSAENQLAAKGPRRFSIVGGGSGIVWNSGSSSSVVPIKNFQFYNPFPIHPVMPVNPRNVVGIRRTSNNSNHKDRDSNAPRKESVDREAGDTVHTFDSFSLSSDEEFGNGSDFDQDENGGGDSAGGGAHRKSNATYQSLHTKSDNDSDNESGSGSRSDGDNDSDRSSSQHSEDGHGDTQGVQKSDVKTIAATRLIEGTTMSTSQRPGRASIYNQILNVIGVHDKYSRRRSVSEQFLKRVKHVSENPDSIRSRVWILLEMPQSSKEARLLQLIIVLFVCISIFILYTQTITQLTLYGETTAICGTLLQAYCSDKDSQLLDPGCFVQDSFGPTSQRLSFNCHEGNCFGHGLNFGSSYTNMTCLSESVLPFQSKTELDYTYGTPYLLTGRQQMHRINPVCTRIECTDNSSTYYDGNPMWIAVEFMINLLFSIELILRIAVAESMFAYWQDKMNLFDIFAVLPFYTTLLQSLQTGGFSQISFSILSSSPDPIVFTMLRSLKVLRLFKLTRHFRASKVLVQTAQRVWRQILGMLAFLCFLVTLFSIIFFEMERGKQCFVGDKGCIVPESLQGTVHEGDLLFINKNGDASQFPNMFFGVWFSFVTLTTTGYGDIVPVTNGGQIMAIFLMLAGSFYMAMPLTAAASTFYTEHEREKERYADSVVAPAPSSVTETAKNAEAPAASRHQNPSFDQRLLLTVRYSMAEIKQNETILSKLIDDVYEYHSSLPSGLITTEKMITRVVESVRNLEVSMKGVERDLVDMLECYGIMLQSEQHGNI